jgi:type IV pilus assembly protein PilW
MGKNVDIRTYKLSAGFSLVELMVGLTIGLVTIVVVTQVMATAERYRKASSSGSDTVVNAALGLYTIEREGKNAGYGMNTVAGSTGCEVRATYGGTAHNFNLVPVVITDGASGAPDQIKFMASGKNGVTLPTRISVDHPQTAANFFVESDIGVEEGDLMIAVPAVMNTASPATTWCSVFQVTGTGGGGGGGGGNGNGNGGGQGQNQVLHNSGQSQWNEPGGHNIFPSGGYSAGDYVVNLGNFIERTYSVDTSSKMLKLTEFNMVSGSNNPAKDLYPHIVQLQAVYGKDTSGTPDGIVDVWNATAPTTTAEWQQIRAIRVALVARGQLQEGVVTLDGANAGSTCASATPHPAAVCWKPDPNGNGVKIDVSANNADWQKYRYRVVETTVPIRNLIWQQ